MPYFQLGQVMSRDKCLAVGLKVGTKDSLSIYHGVNWGQHGTVIAGTNSDELKVGNTSALQMNSISNCDKQWDIATICYILHELKFFKLH